MPVSVKNSQIIFDALKSTGVGLISALPETWLVHLVRMAEDDRFSAQELRKSAGIRR